MRSSFAGLKSRRTPVRDRSCAGLEPITVMGPIVPPTPEEVREILRRSDHADRLLCYSDAVALRQSPVPSGELADFLDAMVQESSATWQTGMAGLIEHAWAPLGLLPFRVTLGPDWAAMQYDHTVGDWSMLEGMRREIFMTPPASMPDRSEPRAPLAIAVSRTLRRRARAVVHVARMPKVAHPPLLPNDAPVRWGSVHGLSEPGLKARRVRDAPPDRRLSAAAWYTARVHQAAAHEGLPLWDATLIVADCRIALPPRSKVSGNFISSALLAPDDVRDPMAWSDTIATYAASPRPVMGLALSTLAMLGPGGRPGRNHNASSPDGTFLASVSYLGRTRWVGPNPTKTYLGAINVQQTHSLAFSGAEHDDRLEVTLGFDPDTLSRERAQAVVDRILDLAW